MVQDVLFSRSKSKVIYPNLTFIEKMLKVPNIKNISLWFKTQIKLESNDDIHFKGKILIVNNIKPLLMKPRHSLPRKPLLSIYKAVLRPHLDYCDVV